MVFDVLASFNFESPAYYFAAYQKEMNYFILTFSYVFQVLFFFIIYLIS